MRIIFTCYAINAAGLCFLLTLALCYLSEDRIEWVAMKLFTYTYIVFGPFLLICCIYGFIFIKGLLFQCTPSRITSSVNFMDVFILIGCTAFSCIITLFYSMHQTVEKAQDALRDEQSVTYRLFLQYLGYRRMKQRQASIRNSRRNSTSTSSTEIRNYQSIDDQEQQVNQQNAVSTNNNNNRRRQRENGPMNSYLNEDNQFIQNTNSDKQENNEKETEIPESQRETRATLNQL